MQTARSTPRKLRLGLAAAALPLLGLVAPAPAHAGTLLTIAICSGGDARTVTIPIPGSPLPPRDDRQACAHFACPRERGQADTADDDE